MHDVSCAEEVLKNFRGIVIGDKGYCSTPLANRLQTNGIRLIARHRKNMAPNTREERKLLRNRPLVETVIGKFKNFFGSKLSHANRKILGKNFCENFLNPKTIAEQKVSLQMECKSALGRYGNTNPEAG
jgi:hypothetical protein